MNNKTRSGPPGWIFTILMVGGFITCGLYLGMMRIEGVSTGDVLRAVGFGVLGFLMLWGALSRRKSK